MRSAIRRSWWRHLRGVETPTGREGAHQQTLHRRLSQRQITCVSLSASNRYLTRVRRLLRYASKSLPGSAISKMSSSWSPPENTYVSRARSPAGMFSIDSDVRTTRSDQSSWRRRVRGGAGHRAVRRPPLSFPKDRIRCRAGIYSRVNARPSRQWNCRILPHTRRGFGFGRSPPAARVVLTPFSRVWRPNQGSQRRHRSRRDA